MHEGAFDLVDFERAPDALTDLARPQHEVLDEELAAAVEQVAQRDLAAGRIKDVLLVDPYPG
jgi:hypothetical protein